MTFCKHTCIFSLFPVEKDLIHNVYQNSPVELLPELIAPLGKGRNLTNVTENMGIESFQETQYAAPLSFQLERKRRKREDGEVNHG